MTAIRVKGPVVDHGTCRCCGVMKKCRLLNYEYDHLGKKEVYSEMVMDCFGLLLSHTDGEESDRLVCATCVVRLREASTFRHQVLLCEEAFLLKMHKGESDCKVKTEFKSEEGSNADDIDLNQNYNDTIDTADSSSDGENVKSMQLNKDDSTKKKKILKRTKAFDETNANTQGSRRSENISVSAAEHIRMKRDLMSRMQKLKSLLNQRLKKSVSSQPKIHREDRPKLPAVRKMSQDVMLRHNAVTIVENSFVCPFKNRISNFYCFYCKEIFTDCSELRAHTLSHNPKTFENFIESKKIPRIDITRIDCRLCAEKISDLDTFKTHITRAHKKIIYPCSSNEFLLFRLSMENLVCLECGCNFPFIDKLIEHMTDHFGKYVCDICGACFIEEISLCQHMRGHKKVDTNFPCEVCGKNLKSNYSRQLHIATVHEKRPVVGCYKCEASFLSYAQRNRHLINVHGDRRKFPCTSCDKVFDVRKTLMEHTRKYHLQVCRHQCDVCEQRFYAPSQLKEHKATHTGERNFRCEYCDKSYPRRQSLQDHLRSHASGRFKCDVCNSTFAQSANLKSHMKSHEGFDLGTYNS